MKLQTVIHGQAIQFIDADAGARKVSPVPWINAMQDRYGFVQVPRTVTELDFSVGANFLQGYYKDTIIDSFKVYNNGLSCEAAADNQICLEFLDEVFEWVPKEFGFPITRREMRAFGSKIEVVSEKDLDVAFKKYAEVGGLITNTLKGYGLEALPYSLAGIILQHEPKAEGFGNPSFEFARRKDHPFDAGIYYSSAPLRTTDHMRVLDLLETIF